MSHIMLFQYVMSHIMFCTLVLMVVPSIRFSILKKLDSSIAATFDKYLMVPLGSSLARASNNNRFFFTLKKIKNYVGSV